MTVLHEPFGNLKNYGETDAEGRMFRSPVSLLTWLRDESRGRGVFFKDTMDHQYDEVLADRHFLAEARHSFLYTTAPRKSQHPITPCSLR